MSMQLKKELSALVEKAYMETELFYGLSTTPGTSDITFRLKDQQKTLMKYGGCI